MAKGQHTNNGNVGKKGISGRKSKYQEIADAERLWNNWTNSELPKQLQEKLNKREGLSLEEMHILRGYLKSDANLNAIFQKLYPDNLKISGALNISKTLDDLENK